MTSDQAKEFLEQLRATRSELDYYKQTSNTKDGRLSQLDTQVKNFDQEKQKLTVSILKLNQSSGLLWITNFNFISRKRWNQVET